MTNKKEDDRIVLVDIERTGHMIPYYEEYCKLIENNPSLEPYKRRLSALDKAEKNLLEMKAEEIAEIISSQHTVHCDIIRNGSMRIMACLSQIAITKFKD